MTRPDSHRDQTPEQRCGNCAFSNLVCYKLDLLCFYGDAITVTGRGEYPVKSDHVSLNGEEVGMLEGDEYSNVWASRIVDPDEVCDKWVKGVEG